MRNSDPDTLLFFGDHPDALELYQAFEDMLYSAFPAFLVQKDEVICAALSAGSTGCFSCVGRQVGQRRAVSQPGFIRQTPRAD